MRILMLNNEFPPLGGGTGTVNRAVLSILARDPEVEIDLVTSAPGTKFEQGNFSDRIKIYKVPVKNHSIHHSTNRELLSYAAEATPLALRLHRSKPYQICLAWASVPAGGVALAIRRLSGLRYIVRVSGPDIPGFEQRYKKLYPILSPFIKSIWDGAEQIVAKCREEADQIRKIDPQVAITIIPNGVDASAFELAAGAPDSGPLRLLCVARLIERKSQHHLIKVVQRLVAEGFDIQLELVGDGDSLADYMSLAQREGVAERVTFTGYVSREAIPAHYAAAHVFVLPSYNEGMSVASLEAMAAGLPLVCTRTGGVADLVKESGPDANGFIYHWNDLDALTLILRRFALDRSLARQMGAASRRRSSAFTWENTSAKIVGLIREAAS